MGILNFKKAQLQIQETIIVVFIFIILIVLGLVFFYRVQSKSIDDDFNRYEVQKLNVDFISLGDLPEFSCSRAGYVENCIDTVKLIAFMALSKSKDTGQYYFDRFGYKNITIYQIYPTKNNNKCSFGQITDCGIWEVYTKKPDKVYSTGILDTPVSLYFPCKDIGCTEDDYGIGMMIVEAYNV